MRQKCKHSIDCEEHVNIKVNVIKAENNVNLRVDVNIKDQCKNVNSLRRRLHGSQRLL